jgi:hypothetical protein
VSLVLFLHAAATLYMTGLIWFVQVVHYPLFGAVRRESFADYEKKHTQLTGRVVTPPMLVELVTAVALVFRRPAALPAVWVWIGLALLVAIWLSTAFLQVPAHRRLLEGFDADVHRRLVRSNWLRTAAWTARGMLALWLLQLG